MISKLLSLGPVYFATVALSLCIMGAGAIMAGVNTYKEAAGALIIAIGAMIYAELTVNT